MSSRPPKKCEDKAMMMMIMFGDDHGLLLTSETSSGYSFSDVLASSSSLSLR